MTEVLPPSAGVRINIIVEGQTEERFVKEMLAPHFGARGAAIYARCVTTSRKRGVAFRGGMPPYAKVRYDLEGWIKQDTGAYVTTMFDLYGLDTGFPGYADVHHTADCHDRAGRLEEAMANDLGSSRFVPYLQVHEFEALLFSAPDILDSEMVRMERLSRRREIERILEQYGDPEKINDGPETAPSRRLNVLYGGYTGIKVLMGSRIAERIGLEIMRERCHHFDAWIRRLEGLPALSLHVRE